MDLDSLKVFRDRFGIPVPDDKLEELPFYKPEPDSPEMKYLLKSREKLGGPVPQRRNKSFSIPTPPLETLKAILDGSGDREISTTMAFVRILAQLVKDKELARASCRSCRTRRAPSAWKACSASSASIRP